jgi:hypothetical protein
LPAWPKGRSRYLPDHEQIAWFGETHHASAARAEHHLLWLDRRLGVAITGEECAVNTDRLTIDTDRHQRHHRRPDTARGMLQTGIEAQRDRSR